MSPRLNLLLVCLSVLALTPVVHAQDDDALLRNAGFDQGPADKPTYWRLYDWRGESQLDVTKQNARTGRALRIVIADPTGRASVTQARFKQQLAKGTTPTRTIQLTNHAPRSSSNLPRSGPTSNASSPSSMTRTASSSASSCSASPALGCLMTCLSTSSTRRMS